MKCLLRTPQRPCEICCWARSTPKSSACTTRRPGYSLASRSTSNGKPRARKTDVQSAWRTAGFEPVGYLPRKMASWLAPLIDSSQVHMDGYVPQGHAAAMSEPSGRSPVVLMVFQCEKGRHILEKTEPAAGLKPCTRPSSRHTRSAQAYREPELILGLAKGLQPLGKKDLLPETRLLLALLPRMANEVRMLARDGRRDQVPRIARHACHRRILPTITT